jgi:hypothetical protein
MAGVLLPHHRAPTMTTHDALLVDWLLAFLLVLLLFMIWDNLDGPPPGA